MREAVSYLREINVVSIMVRLLLVSILSGAIGVERGSKRRPAGFRTHMLVGIGAALVMLTSQYMVEVLQMTADTARLGSQVISGIGFLGAGTIIVVGRHQVKGLTTAAGLWTCACMGLAIGIGFYEGALIGGSFLLLIMMGMRRLDEYVQAHAKVLELYVELDDLTALSRMIAAMKREGTKVSNLEIHRMKQESYEAVSALMTLTVATGDDHTAYLLHLHELEGIRTIEEII